MDEKPPTYEAYDQMAEQYAEAVKDKPHNAYLERPAIRALLPDIQGGKVLYQAEKSPAYKIVPKNAWDENWKLNGRKQPQN